MHRRFVFWALCFSFAVVLSGVSFAQTMPTTAHEVSGPVTGALADPIELSLSPWLSATPSLSNRRPLTISFCTRKIIEEKILLNGRYQPQTRVECQRPSRPLNQRGRRQLTGVTMAPDLPGEWRWRDDYTLVFKPKRAWPTAQFVRVRFDASLFPPQVKLLSRNYDVTTDALTPRLAPMKFFQDPNEIEKRGVSATLSLNTPVAAEALKQHIRFTLEELSDEAGPAHGKKMIVTAENPAFDLKLDVKGMQAEITVPLRALPDKERFLRLEILPGLEALAGGKPLEARGPGWREERVAVPSRFSFAKITNVEARIVANDHGDPEQVLMVETNVPVAPEEMAKHLQIHLLPNDKPAPSPAYSPKKNYAWTGSAEVTDNILSVAPEVKFTVNPVAGSDATLHSVKFETPPRRWLYVRVTKELQAKGGYVLARDHNRTVLVPEFTKQVAFLGDGALLALGGAKKLSVSSLGVGKLKFTIHRVMTQDIGHFVSQSRGDFANPSFVDAWSFDEKNISEVFHKDISLPNDDIRKPQFTTFDFAPYLDASPDSHGLFKDKPKGKGLFFLTVEGIAFGDKGKEYAAARARRFVLVSDLGLIVKTHRGGARTVFVQSVATGQPVSGARVEVLGLNGLSVLQVETSRGGHAEIPDLSGYGDEKKPVALLVRHDDDLAFMPLGRVDRALDYSQFETGGVQAVEDGLRAYLFSDRGIYRPGETAHIGVIVKQGDWTQDLSGLPLQLEITNPRGKIIDKPVVKMNAAGFVEYHFATQEVSPTGVYNIRLFMGQNESRGAQLGATAIRVEEFLPDTMKITSEFNKPIPKGWVTPDGLKAIVKLRHLYGAPAVDHRVKAGMAVAPGSFAFKDYADYAFFDPRRNDKSFDQPVGEAQTDNEGQAQFALDLAQFGASTYRLTFYAEGFAQDSGRSVKTAKSVLVSPLPYVLGAKAKGNLNYIDKGEDQQVHLLALGPDLKPVAAMGLTAQIIQIDYVSSLIKDERGAYAYRSVPKEKIIARGAIDIPAGGMDYRLDSAQAGRYALAIVNAEGLVLSRVPYTVIGAGDIMGRVRKDAVITVRLDKEEYQPGDTITMNIVAPYTGAGLITLETDKVLTFKWFKSTSVSSVQSITIPKDFTGKGFVNIEFLRALDSKEIYTKPLAFAVRPFLVGTDGIDSKIRLTAPETAKPGEELAITYTARSPSKIVVFAVDEGILQYGHYVTPDPLDYFVRRRALQVGTEQMLDLLLPEYNLLSLTAASGGDGALADGKNLNPFKRKTLPPVAYWSGIVDADAEPRVLKYKVPDHFNGALRIMAVAVSDQDMGATETKSFIKGDIILSPNAPLFATPGDEFIVGVGIANNIPRSGKTAKLKLTVMASEHLELLAGAAAEITVPEGGEAKTQVRVRAKDRLGGASLLFTASLGEISARQEATLSVRPPVPSLTVLRSGYTPKGETTVQQARELYPEFASIEASASALPISLIPGLVRYLDAFPYGCTEQILSRNMPAVALYGNPELGGDDKNTTDKIVQTLNRLRELQDYRGGFSLWWRGGQADDFVSLYALHYLTLAKEKRLPVPDDLFDMTQDYVKNLVNRMPSSLQQARNQAYGIYLLTRNGEVTANYLPNLLRYLENEQKKNWKSDLAAVYIAAAYRLMQLVPESEALLDEFSLGDAVLWDNNPRYWSDDAAFYNSLNRYAQYLSIIATHFPERLAKLDVNILFRVANFIGEGSYNTLSSSYAIMAFSDYGAAMAKRQGAPPLTIAARKAGGDFTPLPLQGDLIKRAQPGLEQREIRFAGGAQGLFYQVSTEGYDKTAIARPIEDGLEIARAYLNDAGKPVRETKVGEVLEAVVTMRAHGDRALSNMAVVDLLPAGFEIVPDSVVLPAAVSAEQAYYDEGEGEGEDPLFGGEAAALQDGNSWIPQITDVREDRVIGFGVIPMQPVTWRYKIKAVNAGIFTVPPPYAESMYNLTIKAQGEGGRIEVVDRR